MIRDEVRLWICVDPGVDNLVAQVRQASANKVKYCLVFKIKAHK